MRFYFYAHKNLKYFIHPIPMPPAYAGTERPQYHAPPATSYRLSAEFQFARGRPCVE